MSQGYQHNDAMMGESWDLHAAWEDNEDTGAGMAVDQSGQEQQDPAQASEQYAGIQYPQVYRSVGPQNGYQVEGVPPPQLASQQALTYGILGDLASQFAQSSQTRTAGSGAAPSDDATFGRSGEQTAFIPYIHCDDDDSYAASDEDDSGDDLTSNRDEEMETESETHDELFVSADPMLLQDHTLSPSTGQATTASMQSQRHGDASTHVAAYAYGGLAASGYMYPNTQGMMLPADPRFQAAAGQSSTNTRPGGRKRSGSTLSAASATIGLRDGHVPKKQRNAPQQGFQAARVGTPRTSSTGNDPYAMPVTRGEVTELRRELHEFTEGMRDFQTSVMDMLKAHFPVNQISSPPSGPSAQHQSAGSTPAPAKQPHHFVPKRTGAPTRRSDEELALARDVQGFARVLMKRETADSPFDADSLAKPEEVTVFEQSTSGAHCCDAATFRIDINKGALNKWNRSAALVFARAFVDSGLFDENDEAEIAAAFLTHVRTLRKKFREAGFTAIQLRDQKKKANRDQRKITLFQRRRKVCVKYPQLNPHLEMLERFGVDGMSSDESESENGVKQYVILNKSWRTDEVTFWLRGIDAVVALTTKARGNRPRVRMMSTRFDDSRSAVQGLPKNAYNSTCEEEYDFKHCDSVKIALEAYSRQLNLPAQYR